MEDDPEDLLSAATERARIFVENNPFHPLSVPFQSFLRPELSKEDRFFHYFAWLRSQWQQKKDRNLLDRAIYVAPCCLAGWGDSPFPSDEDGLSEYAWRLNQIASLIFERYNTTSHPVDLDVAIAICEAGLNLFPVNNTEEYAISAITLCSLLRIKMDRVGLDSDLDGVSKVISLLRDTREKVEAIPPPHIPEYPMIVHTVKSVLGMCLETRFTKFADVRDLKEAVPLFRSALEEAREYSLPEAIIATDTNNLAAALVSLAEHNRYDPMASSFILEGIALLEEALLLTDSSSPLFYKQQFNLALAFAQTVRYSDVPDYHDQAVSLLKDIINNPSCPLAVVESARHSLISTVFLRAELKNDEESLDECLRLAQQEDLLSKEFTTHSATSILTLALALRSRTLRTKDSSFLKQAAPYARSLYSRQKLPFHFRFTTAFSFARFHHAAGLLEEALGAYRMSLELLPIIAMDGKLYKDTLSEIGSSDLGLDAASCRLALGGPNSVEDALELIEQGRTIGWHKSLKMRADLKDLERDHPDYANQLSILAGEIEKLDVSAIGEYSDTSGGDGGTWERSVVLTAKWNEILAEIHSFSGYENFLGFPRFEELRSAADEGPVIVINISSHGSDAIIITPDLDAPPHRIQLPVHSYSMTKTISKEFQDLTHDQSCGTISLEDFIRQMNSLLVTLWKDLVKPILSELEIVYPSASRIWWCPTGRLTFLPLHLFTKRPDGMEIVSSYTTSLSALIRARKNQKDHKDESVRVLGVGCVSPPEYEERKIPGAAKEMQIIRKAFVDTPVTILQDEEATTDNVLSKLDAHSWVHFACHGLADKDRPYRSSFLLNDGHLHASSLIAKRLGNAEFVFLSACHAAVGMPNLYDEALHLAATMQFVGFRATVATMWALDDDVAPLVVEEFYKNLTEGGRMPDVRNSAEALHDAIVSLKKKGIHWVRLAPLIHIGM